MQIKVRRWFLVLVTVMSLTCIALPALAIEKEVPGGKVAVVNGSVITRENFDREMILVQQRVAREGRSLGDSQLLVIKNQVLENLINRELLYQESQKKGIKVKEETVKGELERLKNRFASEEEFNNTLSKMNVTEELVKSQIERGLAIQEFIDKQFGQKITVPEKEVKAFYDGHPDSFKQPEQVRASHILIKVDPQGDESQKTAARKKIQEIQGKLQKGEDFATQAREFSQGPSSANGGDLGYFRRGQMVKPFEDAAFALAPGEVSNIIETQFGYHIIKLTGKQPETTIAYDAIKDRLQKYLEEQKVQEQVNTYIEEVKGKAKVERFLTEVSK
ncbi:MAG: peptidylprolyl isomerase [Deltaproteobacteria bacterium]|nr:MAG: peptidylprolyl isomerase [Deltaproteobacteria bacterium]